MSWLESIHPTDQMAHGLNLPHHLHMLPHNYLLTSTSPTPSDPFQVPTLSATRAYNPLTLPLAVTPWPTMHMPNLITPMSFPAFPSMNMFPKILKSHKKHVQRIDDEERKLERLTNHLPRFVQESSECGLEATAVWKNLRVKHKIANKKVCKLSGSAAIKEEKKWIHYSDMAFLNSHLEERTEHTSCMAIAEITLDENDSEETLSSESPIPRKEAEWAAISREFWNRWQVPMVLGAIDGKHVVMKKPANSGSLYYNYKGSCSIVVTACVDAKYRCLMCDFGRYGHNGDAGWTLYLHLVL
uniref:DDE Tnp4 domain-containing protein n=1 Tax=Ditylenchus dipsaci TaxID=166011 RepID=A0A915D1I5_9BILA